MAIKISGMTAAAASLLTHEFEVNEGGLTRKVTAQQLLDRLILEGEFATAAQGALADTALQTMIFAEGEGSPVGVVTPVLEGRLYLQTSPAGLWISTGATNVDWKFFTGDLAAASSISWTQHGGAGTPNKLAGWNGSGSPVFLDPAGDTDAVQRTFSGTIAPDARQVTFATFIQSGAVSFTKGAGAVNASTLYLPFDSDGVGAITWNAGFRAPFGNTLPALLPDGLHDLFFYYHLARNDILVTWPE